MSATRTRIAVAASVILAACAADSGTSLFFSSLTAGSSANCAVSQSGTALCWGLLPVGTFGAGVSSDTALPVAVVATEPVLAVSLGVGHACALTRELRVLCWGSAAAGELGFGDDSTGEVCVAPLSVACSTQPRAVKSQRRFRSVRSSAHYSCALAADGQAWCWGSNTVGTLGVGALQGPSLCASGYCSPEPLPVAGNHAFTVLSLGELHACGLEASGQAFCWGANYHHQLGDDTAAIIPYPVPAGGQLRFSSIHAGESFTCGLTPAGRAWCWGRNMWGELGDSSFIESAVPRPMAGHHLFTAISVGVQHGCGLVASGAAFCWGRNDQSGLLGDGTLDDQPYPRPVLGGLSFESIAVGGGTTCGLTRAGSVVCWGLNFFGQLGDGSRTTRTMPTLVSLPLPE